MATAGRKPTPLAADHADPDLETPEAASAIAAIQTQDSALQAAYSDDRDLANQLLGQAQMARSIAKFADVVSLSKLQHVKESKLYKALAGKTMISPDGSECRLVGTWEEYCKLLGSTRSTIDEDLTNLKVFGEQALENLSRIGAGYRELRQFRRLPDDQKTALIELSKTGDKESVLELAEELIAKQVRAKDDLEKKLTEAQAKQQSTERLIEAKNKAIDEKTAELDRLINGSADAKKALANEQDAALVQRLQDASLALLGYIVRFDNVVADCLADATEARATLAENAVLWTFQRIAQIALDRQMPCDFRRVVDPLFEESAEG
jgi:hypothetical protein